jgi:hypothetical protein
MIGSFCLIVSMALYALECDGPRRAQSVKRQLEQALRKRMLKPIECRVKEWVGLSFELLISKCGLKQTVSLCFRELSMCS